MGYLLTLLDEMGLDKMGLDEMGWHPTSILEISLAVSTSYQESAEVSTKWEALFWKVSRPTNTQICRDMAQ